MMTDFDSKRRQFEKRLDDISRTSLDGRDSAGLNLKDNRELERRLQEWEAMLDQRLEEHRQILSGENSTGIQAQEGISDACDLSLQALLRLPDVMMVNELKLRRYIPPQGFTRPVQISSNDEEVHQILKTRAGLHDLKISELAETGVYHLPGFGTLVNQAHYMRRFGVNDLEHLNEEQAIDLVDEVITARWGWGFLMEYSTFGQAAGAAGLYPALFARRHHLNCTDRWAVERADFIERTWLLLCVGWCDWVRKYALFKAHHPLMLNRSKEKNLAWLVEVIGKISSLFPFYIQIAPLGIRLRSRSLIDLVKFVFFNNNDSFDETQSSVISTLKDICLEYDARVEEAVGETLSRMMARLYFARLEARTGILSLPFAVLVAAHVGGVQFKSGESLEELAEKIEENPRLNPDYRLALLIQIDPRVRYNIDSLMTAAWEQFRLDVPGNIR